MKINPFAFPILLGPVSLQMTSLQQTYANDKHIHQACRAQHTREKAGDNSLPYFH